MLQLNNLSSTLDYDFDQYSPHLDMSNKLFCTFSSEENLPSLIEQITNRYEILYQKIFVLECLDHSEFVVTYNVDLNNIGTFLDNTILVHRKKHTNTLYTINALNELIIKLNNGYLDTNYMINWDKYKNSILLTKNNDLQIIKTKLFQIIEI